MTATAESFIPEYGQSLRVIENLGRQALGGAVVAAETGGAFELGYADFNSAVSEMLKTLPEFRNALDIDRRHEHQIIAGQVCDDEGTPMVDILRGGQRASRAAAESEPAMADQADRDHCDVVLAERVDAMAVGKTLWGISMDPKQSLAKHPEIFKRRLGYKEGLLYIQAYSKVSENELVTFSYSVDMSDEALWRTVAADNGMDIPQGTSANEWLLHAVEVEADPQQTLEFLTRLRKDYYRRARVGGKRHSVSEFVDSHDESLRGLFGLYYPPLGEASRNRQNHPILQDFAKSLLQTDLSKMKPEIRQQLMRLANSPKFDQEMGQTVNALIRYAAAEELQQYLPKFLVAKDNHAAVPVAATTWFKPIVGQVAAGLQHAHEMLTHGIGRGIKAGRSYGGCPGNIELSMDESSVNNFQEAYGGHAEPKPEEACEEITDGQEVTCPGCKKQVKAIVPDRETIYCSNAECEYAAPDLKQKNRASFFGKILERSVTADKSKQRGLQPV